MKKSNFNAILIFPILIWVDLLFACAVNPEGRLIFGLPAFALLAGLILLIQWLAFIPAFILQNEKFFDLTASFTFIFISTCALFLNKNIDIRSILLWLLVMIWAIRLGTFLFKRIKKAGKDDRFDELKISFFRFLNVWTVQALWITFTIAAALVAILTENKKQIDILAIIGILIWLFGFIFETVADWQKSRFKSNPANHGKFIQSGLWSKSRHPNYFGEIMIWTGIAIIAVPVFRGFEWLAMISPVFVTLLLTKVSGIPLLEKKADKKWGDQEDYKVYKKRTPVLIPKL